MSNKSCDEQVVCQTGFVSHTSVSNRSWANRLCVKYVVCQTRRVSNASCVKRVFVSNASRVVGSISRQFESSGSRASVFNAKPAVLPVPETRGWEFKPIHDLALFVRLHRFQCVGRLGWCKKEVGTCLQTLFRGLQSYYDRKDASTLPRENQAQSYVEHKSDVASIERPTSPRS